jgi:FkbM family methyltransferase
MASVRSWLLRLAGWASAALPTSIIRRLYRLGPLTQALRSTLNQAAPSGMTQVEITAGLLVGASFRLDLQREKDLWLGTYEPDLQRKLRQVLAPGMVVYDVGANIGYLTVGIARLVGSNGRVVAFEPLPSNYLRLREAMKLNEFEGRVQAVQAAVGERPGTARFLVHASGGMGKLVGSAGRQAQYVDEIEVRVVQLDGFVAKGEGEAPDWIKIDVEGGEAKVLAGAEDLLRRARPGLLLELHGPEAAAGVWRRLGEWGYVLDTLAPVRGPVTSVDELGWKSYVVAEPEERSRRHGR